jgi:hypothetical protein
MRVEQLEKRLRNPHSVGDWPTWEDLMAAHVVQDNSIICAITEKLASFKHCILSAPEGRGKTSLARLIGFRYAVQGREVLQVDCSDPGDRSVGRICAAIKGFDADAVRPVYIIENVHDIEDPDELRQLVQTAMRTSASEFLYTERVPGNSSIFDDLDLAIGGREITRREIEFRLEPAEDTIRQIIAAHIRLTQKQGLRVPEALEYPKIRWRCGGNLRILTAFLEAWESGSISDVSEDEVLDVVYRRRLAPIREDLQVALVAISAIAQFGIPVMGAVFGNDGALELAKNRILGHAYVGIEPFFTLPHSSDGSMNVSAWASHNGVDRNTVTLDALQRYARFESSTKNFVQFIWRLRLEKSLWQTLLMSTGIDAAFLRDSRSVIGNVRVAYLRDIFQRLGFSRSLQQSFARLVSGCGPTFWAEKIRHYNGERRAASALKDLSVLTDKTFSDAVAETISGVDWEEIWLRSSLSQLTKFLWRYAENPHPHEHTEQAKRVLMRLPQETDLAGNLKRVSYENVGKLLLISRRLAKPAAQGIAEVVANHIDLHPCNEPHRLTLILGEMWQSESRNAFFTLVTRIVDNVPIEKFGEEAGRAGLPYMLYSISKTIGHGVSLDRAREIVSNMLSPATAVQLQNWNPREVRRFLWAALIIDREATKVWVRGIGAKNVKKLCLNKSSPLEQFFLLWNLIQIDAEIGKEITLAIWESSAVVMNRKGEVDCNDLPLVGLCAWLLGLKTIPFQLPEPTVAALDLAKEPDASALVFAKRSYDLVTASSAKDFLSRVSRSLKNQSITRPVAFLTDHPKIAIRYILLDILKSDSAVLNPSALNAPAG